MQITRNVFTISDLNTWFEEKSLIINRDYQREGGIWPPNARTYFIDTILNGFPFPKVTLRQKIDLKTKKNIREIIDGQQRIMTINDFINNKFKLSSISKNFHGLDYESLDDSLKETILNYEVSVDLVLSGSEEDILGIFRRINSYNLQLNESETRHASYQGEFKWFIRDLIENYSILLETYSILTRKQISRMLDADLFTELAELALVGITNRSSKSLENLYKENDKSFSDKLDVQLKITDSLEYLKNNLTPILDSRLLNGFQLYSLVGAMFINKYGLKNSENQNFNFTPINSFCIDDSSAVENVLLLLSAYDTKDLDGNYSEFVKASTSSTHRVNNRIARVRWFAKALRNEL